MPEIYNNATYNKCCLYIYTFFFFSKLVCSLYSSAFISLEIMVMCILNPSPLKTNTFYTHLSVQLQIKVFLWFVSDSQEHLEIELFAKSPLQNNSGSVKLDEWSITVIIFWWSRTKTQTEGQ